MRQGVYHSRQRREQKAKEVRVGQGVRGLLDDELDGVERSKADHTTGEVELTYDPARVTDEELRGAIEEAGYTLQR